MYMFEISTTSYISYISILHHIRASCVICAAMWVNVLIVSLARAAFVIAQQITFCAALLSAAAAYNGAEEMGALIACDGL